MTHQTPAEDRPRKRGDRKVEEAKRKFNRVLKYSLAIAILLAGGVVYTLGFHTVTKADTCEAFNKSIAINMKFMRHLERKSIENVEAGNTSSTTSVPEIKKFFDPTIRELQHTHC